MLHPIFLTVLGHPELIADHLGNYAALLRQEAGEASRRLVTRILAGMLAAASAALALGLVGVAVMLGVLHGSFHWVLIAVPGVAIIFALLFAWVACRPAQAYEFEDLRAQVDADLRALRDIGDRHAH
jgi:hypothetical protein